MNLNDIYKIISDGIRNGEKLETYIDLVSLYNGDDWEQYTNDIEMNPGIKYFKIHIYSNELIDMYIIIWPVNSVSGTHAHSEEGCILKMLDGEMEETIYTQSLQMVKTTQISTDEVSFITNDIGYHNMKNISDDISVSLHIYSPGGYDTVYFDT